MEQRHLASLQSPADVFPVKPLARALKYLGKYVYGYYRPADYTPFYVGKGTGSRVLTHWKRALTEPTLEHESVIRDILEKGEVPGITFLGYRLDKSREARYTLAERVLQDAFGIQYVLEKRNGKERLEKKPSSLLQKREDSSQTPPLSLEAAIALSSRHEKHDADGLRELAAVVQRPILLVGLSETYHPSYQSCQLREMARMYWNLDRFKNTSLPALLSNTGWLLAWSSSLNDSPVIVGGWEIHGPKYKTWDEGRYEFPAVESPQVRKQVLGMRLAGTGNNWQGPRIFVPSAE